MKILKPGKVGQRKFVCPRCGCEFAATCTEIEEGVYVRCPQDGCRYGGLEWGDGEPYEEPTQDADVIEQLADLIYDGCVTDGGTAWELAKHLIAHSVIFREERSGCLL